MVNYMIKSLFIQIYFIIFVFMNNSTKFISHNLLSDLKWMEIKTHNRNSTLYCIDGKGTVYLELTPCGILKWYSEMYDNHYGRYGISLGDFRTYIRNLVYSKFDRHIYECKKTSHPANVFSYV